MFPLCTENAKVDCSFSLSHSYTWNDKWGSWTPLLIGPLTKQYNIIHNAMPGVYRLSYRLLLIVVYKDVGNVAVGNYNATNQILFVCCHLFRICNIHFEFGTQWVFAVSFCFHSCCTSTRESCDSASTVDVTVKAMDEIDRRIAHHKTAKHGLYACVLGLSPCIYDYSYI